MNALDTFNCGSRTYSAFDGMYKLRFDRAHGCVVATIDGCHEVREHMPPSELDAIARRAARWSPDELEQFVNLLA